MSKNFLVSVAVLVCTVCVRFFHYIIRSYIAYTSNA